MATAPYLMATPTYLMATPPYLMATPPYLMATAPYLMHSVGWGVHEWLQVDCVTSLSGGDAYMLERKTHTNDDLQTATVQWEKGSMCWINTHKWWPTNNNSQMRERLYVLDKHTQMMTYKQQRSSERNALCSKQDWADPVRPKPSAGNHCRLAAINSKFGGQQGTPVPELGCTDQIWLKASNYNTSAFVWCNTFLTTILLHPVSLHVLFVWCNTFLTITRLHPVSLHVLFGVTHFWL